MSKIRLWMLFILFVSLLCWCRSFTNASEPKVHLLIIADTADELIGDSVVVDYRNIIDSFASMLPEKNLEITTVCSKTMMSDFVSRDNANIKLTPKNVFNTIDQLKVGNKDCIVFYFCGHGKYDIKKYCQYFTIGGIDIRREEIVSALKNKKANLVMCMSDCCNVIQIKETRERQAASVIRPDSLLKPVRKLFFETTGTININSCAIGQVAMGDGKDGGLFTKAVTYIWKLLGMPDVKIDWSWKIVFEETQILLSSYYNDIDIDKRREVRGIDGKFSVQNDQNLLIYSIPGMKLRFGVTVQVHSQDGTKTGGVKVLKVVKDSSAEKAGIKVNDIITKINGINLESLNDFNNAVDYSPNIMKVEIIRNGKTQILRTEMKMVTGD